MIIIIEDCCLNQKLLEQALSRVLGKQEKIICFIEGAGAISFIEENRKNIKLIFLDGNLANKHLTVKRVDGPDVALHIPLHIPVIVWTDDPHMVNRFIKVFQDRKFSYTAFLEKQINLDQLTYVLSPIISNSSCFKKLSLDEVIEPTLGPQIIRSVK